jgi:hypothetical protein
VTQYHRVCCCEGGDCCTVWNCATQNLTHVVITYSVVTTRTYANGQSFVISDAVWTLEGDLTWNNSGQNCNNWRYECAQLDMSFNCITRTPIADTFTDGAPYGPGPGYGPCSSTLPVELQPCSGCRCEETGEFVCDYDIVYCVGSTLERSWTGTVQRTGAGTQKTLVIGCTECCGCVRPFMELDPNGAGAFTEITNSETYDEQCCGFDSNDYSTTWSPGWGVAGNEFTFAILGTCNCMNATAFADPVFGDQACTGQGNWNAPFMYAAMQTTCMSSQLDCQPVNSTEYAKGVDHFEWVCEYWFDGVQQINYCTYDMGYTDTTVRSITVTLT